MIEVAKKLNIPLIRFDYYGVWCFIVYKFKILK